MNKVMTFILIALCFLVILMFLAELVGIQSQLYRHVTGEVHESYFIKPVTEWFEDKKEDDKRDTEDQSVN